MMPSVKEPLAGLALLVILGFLIWYNRPLENPGLFDPYPQDEAARLTGQGAYEAWLWQDPFGFDPDYGLGGAAEEWALAARGKKRDENFSTAVPVGLTCKKSLNEALNLDKNKSEGIPERIVLAPLVKVAPRTVENKEMRTRQRYAVVTGLMESGYQPVEPGTLHFCSIQENRRKKDGGEKDRREYDMRWERYRHESTSKDGESETSKPDIVVAWIDSAIVTDESKFPAKHPCTKSCDFAFKNLLKNISKNNRLYLFDVSNTLDAERSCQIESHIGCIHDQNVKSAGINGKVENIQFIKLAGMERKNASKKTGSEKLTELLAKELTLRGVTHQSQVMTISELNSENAAMLAGNLRKTLTGLLANQECASQECGNQTSANDSGPANHLDEIRNVFYLKGLDGKSPAARDQYGKDKNAKDGKDRDERGRGESGRADKDEKAPSIELRRSPPLSVGASQLDYFHRLAEEMNNAHHVVDFDKRDSGIRAVVILGSNFHDKLLIIQVLREKMPHLLVLTTDLDAQMLHSKHWRATRNLVVASHFDLRLREKPRDEKNEVTEVKKEIDNWVFWENAYQDRFPPFRDSQQTNIFYRTFSIADGGAKGSEKSAETFPRIFEVGRNGFVRLGSAEKTSTPDYHPLDNTRGNTAKELWLLFPIALCLIVLHWVLRPRSGRSSGYLFFGTLIIFAFAFGFGTYLFPANKLKEPFSFADSVSLWPTLFIQIIAVLLALSFFVQTKRELKESFCHLSRRYFSNSSLTPDKPVKCELWLKKLKEWGTFVVLLVVLIVTIGAYALNDVYPSKFHFGWCFGFLAVVAIIYLFLIEGLKITKDVSIKRWVEIDNWSKKSTDGNKSESFLWDEYYNHGQLSSRSIRVVWIWLIFAIIETLLIYLLPPWPLPWRGAADPANWLDIIHLAPGIGVLSFTVTMLLLFFVLDAVRLNFYWIRKLCTQHPWLGGSVPNRLDYSSTSQRLEGLENIVSIVAARTQAVDRLIYYPMLCIMLMLLAKITYFDNQEFPLSKGITFAVAISFLFFSGFVLRHEANKLRNCVKKSLQDLRVNNATRRIDETICRIDTIDEGAFQPMLEQPVMQALLIMLASVGLFAGEYLKVFG